MSILSKARSIATAALTFTFGPTSKITQNAGWVLAAVALGIVLIIYVSLRAFFAPSAIETRIDDRKPEIVNAQVDTGVKTEEVNRATVKVSDSGKVTRTASNEREKAIKKDSKEYANDNAGERFCARFPNDSSCQK